MKGLFLLLGSIVLCGLFACDRPEESKIVIPEVEKTDSCQQDPNHTYEVYIPKQKKAGEKLPLVIILDAHGSGKFALSKFKTGANQYPAVLVASNRVKNGFENYVTAIQTLVEDVKQKYPVGESVFVSGFSGGARMAMGYALSHPVNGLIMCGALAGADQINALKCPVISISGMDDFNFVETAQYLFQKQSIPQNLKIELTSDSHNWPDSLMLSDALGFLLLSDQSTVIPAKSQIKDYCLKQQARIDKLQMQGDFLKAALVARNLSTTDPFKNDKKFAFEYDQLETTAKYNSQLKTLEKNLNLEMSVRKPYLEAFTTKDSLWWKSEINSMNEKMSSEQDPFTVDMYHRIKAFWGIACYSLCNQAVQDKNRERLAKILFVYRMLEPENSDMFYFSAFPSFWKGDEQATVSMLKNAREAGFSDFGRMKKDFPETITSKVN